VSDLRQEVYVRVYESAAKVLPRSPKTFLFRTAHNMIVDRIRRDGVVSIECTQDLNLLHLAADELTPERCVGARDDLYRLACAFDSLPEMTRAVIWLRRVEGLSQREAARRLGIDEGALEGHMTRGLRRLARDLTDSHTRAERAKAGCAVGDAPSRRTLGHSRGTPACGGRQRLDSSQAGRK